METGKAGKLNINNYSIIKLLLIFVIPAISILYVSGQKPYNEHIYNAFINGRMDLWEYNMNKMGMEWVYKIHSENGVANLPKCFAGKRLG